MTEKLDIITALKEIGVPEDKATDLAARIKGEDFMNLVNSLKSQNSVGRQTARSILGKYGIRLENEPMKDNYLSAKFESLRSGENLDETFGVMTALGEGFTYAVEVTEQTRDKVLDWLDENEVAYQATNPLSYRIECQDRDAAYRTGRALSGILSKQAVRDSVEVDEAKSKSAKKREKEAKAKLDTIKPRNPLAAMPVAGKAGAHADGKDPRKVDNMGRGAKHKNRRFDEEFTVGQDVMVGEVAGTVKIPHGPNGTVGVIMNGQLEMVAETEVSRLDEGVIGMNKVNPLFRLRELAGLPVNTNEDDFEGIEIADAPEIDPEGILAAGPVGVEPEAMDAEVEGPELPNDLPGDEMVDLPTDDMAPEAGMDDMTPELDMGSDLDPDAGMPGAIGSDPIEAVAPMQSEAMGEIEDALNNIQIKLADIRLAEYKSLIKKLQDLTTQVQMMGRDYLGERRKK